MKQFEAAFEKVDGMNGVLVPSRKQVMLEFCTLDRNNMLPCFRIDRNGHRIDRFREC